MCVGQDQLGWSFANGSRSKLVHFFDRRVKLLSACGQIPLAKARGPFARTPSTLTDQTFCRTCMRALREGSHYSRARADLGV